MTVREVNDQANAVPIASLKETLNGFTDTLKEVDWKGLPVKIVSFAKDNFNNQLDAAKTEPMRNTIAKLWNVGEMIPFLHINAWFGVGRMAYAIGGIAKDSMASWTVRPFTMGIGDTFKKYWMEDMPHFLKHLARGAFVFGCAGHLTHNNSDQLLLCIDKPFKAALAVAAYDAITNNVEAAKKNKWVPNYWA